MMNRGEKQCILSYTFLDLHARRHVPTSIEGGVTYFRRLCQSKVFIQSFPF